MELLRGESLTTRIKRKGKLPPNEAVALVMQTASALGRPTPRASFTRSQA